MMEDLQGGEDDNSFPQEEVEKCVQDAVEQVLQNAVWNELEVPQWINDICEKSMKSLVEINRNYKFVVTCMLMQKTGAGVQTSLSCTWENNTDGVYQLVFPNLRAKDSAQKTVQCIATVFCVKF